MSQGHKEGLCLMKSLFCKLLCMFFLVLFWRPHGFFFFFFSTTALWDSEFRGWIPCEWGLLFWTHTDDSSLTLIWVNAIRVIPDSRFCAIHDLALFFPARTPWSFPFRMRNYIPGTAGYASTYGKVVTGGSCHWWGLFLVETRVWPGASWCS